MLKPPSSRNQGASGRNLELLAQECVKQLREKGFFSIDEAVEAITVEPGGTVYFGDLIKRINELWNSHENDENR